MVPDTVESVLARSNAILELRGVTAGYGRTTVLREIDLLVQIGSVVAVLGPNGAGKTTLLRVASGLLSPTRGDVSLDLERVTGRRPFRRSRRGLCLIPEGGAIFPNLSVRENLLLQVPTSRRQDGFDAALDAFPVLGQRLGHRAGTLSGGQQRMLALSRCFLAQPKIVLLDEVSMGLAPRAVDEIFAALQRLAARGVALVLVEQYVDRALQAADEVYLLSRGRVVFHGEPDQLDRAELARRYIGASSTPVPV